MTENVKISECLVTEGDSTGTESDFPAISLFISLSEEKTVRRYLRCQNKFQIEICSLNRVDFPKMLTQEKMDELVIRKFESIPFSHHICCVFKD